MLKIIFHAHILGIFRVIVFILCVGVDIGEEWFGIIDGLISRE